MNSKRRTLHTSRVKCTRAKQIHGPLFARGSFATEIAISRSRKKKKNSVARPTGGRRAKEERERERETVKKKDRKGGKKRKHSYLSAGRPSISDATALSIAPSILFPPVDLWRTMHYVNCERAAGDRGKSNNTAGLSRCWKSRRVDRNVTGRSRRDATSDLYVEDNVPESADDVYYHVTSTPPRGYALVIL